MPVTNEKRKSITMNKEAKQIDAARLSKPVRIKLQTRSKLDELLKRANKNQLGRKVKPDDLICCALDLLDSKHLEEVRDNLLTNRDRFDLLFRQIQKSNRNLNRDQFIGMLLDGKINSPASE